MCRAVWQLIGTTVTLVHFLYTIRFIAGTIRRSSVIEGSAGSGHIHFPSDNVIPDASQVFHQLLFSCLGIYICYACIKIIGTYGMSHCTILITERDTVLIIVRTVLYHTANINQILRKFQITGIFCGTIHLNHSHIV